MAPNCELKLKILNFGRKILVTVLIHFSAQKCNKIRRYFAEILWHSDFQDGGYLWLKPTDLLASMELRCSSFRLGREDCIARSIMVSARPAGAGGGGDAVRPCARLHSPSLYGTRRPPTMSLGVMMYCGGVGEQGSGSLAARGEYARTSSQNYTDI